MFEQLFDLLLAAWPAVSLVLTGLVFGAVTITNIYSLGPETKIADIEATADADTTATFAHGLGAAPAEVYFTYLLAAGALSLWRATTVDGTNVVCTKSTPVGSGAAGAQVRLIVKRPHTLGR